MLDDGDATPALVHARSLALPRLSAPPKDGFYLAVTDERLVLQRADQPQAHGLTVNAGDPAIMRRLASGRRSLLARALGLHRRPNIRVLDTTCGLGRDSMVLAALGCRVTALERHPAVHALVADARRRMMVTAPDQYEHFEALHHADAAAWLTAAAAGTDRRVFDAVYIDPMFDNTRRKARPKQALQWLADLVGADDDADKTLALARRQAIRRVVVKNHPRAQPLAEPDMRMAGKSVRFDIYLNASKKDR